MDFRDNWLAQLKAALALEAAEAGGEPAGRIALAIKLECGEQTIYQICNQKSKKTYPSVKMMVMLEKKYGAGRAPGWASLPLEPLQNLGGNVLHIGAGSDTVMDQLLAVYGRLDAPEQAALLAMANRFEAALNNSAMARIGKNGTA